MKTWLSIGVLLCSYLTCFGQASIKGRVTDHQQHLPLVTVLLLSTDSVLVKGVITNTVGEFIFDSVRPAHYLIACSMVGYTKFISPPISVEAMSLVLPDILLQEASTALGEVVITANKPLFEQQIDRLVVNVQSSITASGNTLLEVLQKSPGVVVNRQNNSITMNGKAGVRIMINEKVMQLPLEVVMQMLDGLPASNVEKIELITTPPAKYDAEGNAGIIHIVTKANTDLGTNGSVGLTLGAHWAETLGGNITFTHRSNRLAFALDYAILRNHNLHTMKMDRQFVDNEFVQTVHDDSHRENVTTQQNLSASFEYKLTDRITLSLLFTGYRRNWDMNALATDNNHVASDSTVITHLNIHESNIWQSATGAIGMQTKINSKSAISFNLDYLYYHNDNPSSYDNKLFYEQRNIQEAAKIDLKKNTPVRFLVGKADYQYDLSPAFTLEAGVKAVTSHLNNDVVVQRWVNDGWMTDPVFTSSSTLSEQVGAAYVATKWQAGRQWQVNSGLRYEYTHTSISAPGEKNLINRKYGYWFPSVSLKKELTAEKDFQVAYSRRITRPTYNDIAPYVFFWGPNTFSAGNTSLWPAVSDALKVGYHVKQWITSLQFSHARNEITFWQPETDSQSNLIYRSQNLNYLNTLGLTNSYSFNITSWWDAQSNLTAQYQVAQTSHLPHNTALHQYGLNFNLVNAWKLPKDFAIEISGMYQSKSLSGIAAFLPIWSLNAGIQKKLGEKGTLRLAMDDILNTNYWRIKTNIPNDNLNSYFNYNFHNQFVRLTYSRSLGNNKLRSVKLKSDSDEERGRITN